MIIKYSLARLVVITLLIQIFPFIQKQWFNLYSFNTSILSFHTILYYFSGMIIPLLISYVSLKEFTDYRFNCQLKGNRLISGKSLLILFLVTIFPLSFLVTNFFFINLDLAFNLFFKISFFSQISLNEQIIFIMITNIFLIFRKSRIFIKFLTLVNFFFITLFLWHAQINNLLIGENVITNYGFISTNINIINVLFLLSIEIIYYFWSFISNNNNLSDWRILAPLKADILGVTKILIFYLFIFAYYS